MKPLDALIRASQEFGRRLQAVAADQWTLATPCTKWTVEDLVDHVIGGNRFAVLLLDGATTEEAMAAARASDFTGSKTDLYEESVAAQIRAFEADGALDRICDHPAGKMPGLMLLGFRVGDISVHAWDLARAIGADESLDPGVVEYAYATFAPLAEALPGRGVFGAGASGQVPDDAPTQERLLDLTGRRP